MAMKFSSSETATQQIPVEEPTIRLNKSVRTDFTMSRTSLGPSLNLLKALSDERENFDRIHLSEALGLSGHITNRTLRILIYARFVKRNGYRVTEGGRAAQKEGLHGVKAYIMELADKGPISLGDLILKQRMEKRMAIENLEKLVDYGYLERLHYFVTEKGRKFMAANSSANADTDNAYNIEIRILRVLLKGKQPRIPLLRMASRAEGKTIRKVIEDMKRANLIDKQRAPLLHPIGPSRRDRPSQGNRPFWRRRGPLQLYSITTKGIRKLDNYDSLVVRQFTERFNELTKPERSILRREFEAIPYNEIPKEIGSKDQARAFIAAVLFAAEHNPNTDHLAERFEVNKNVIEGIMSRFVKEGTLIFDLDDSALGMLRTQALAPTIQNGNLLH